MTSPNSLMHSILPNSFCMLPEGTQSKCTTFCCDLLHMAGKAHAIVRWVPIASAGGDKHLNGGLVCGGVGKGQLVQRQHLQGTSHLAIARDVWLLSCFLLQSREVTNIYSCSKLQTCRRESTLDKHSWFSPQTLTWLLLCPTERVACCQPLC